MLAVDNNKIKLLKMKEKLLEIYGDNKSDEYIKTLEEYSNLATEIDREVYDAFVNKIKNTNYQSLPYNEQLELLQGITDEYEDIYELQCSFNNTYQERTGKNLHLSDMSNILLDSIERKTSSLVGFLNNEKMLESSKEELNKVNAELAVLERKRNSAFDRFSAMEKNLQYEFMNADSIIEYSDNGFDLRKLLTDKELLDKVLAEENEHKDAAEEKLVAAKICCESVPSSENKEIYESISNDMLWARYRLTLLHMVSLVASQKETYEDLVEKREQLKALNDVRDNCLRKLNFKYFAAILSNYKLDSQLEIIKNYEELEEKITVLRKQVVNLSKLVDNRQNNNTDYIIDLNGEYKFIKDKTNFDKVVTESLGEEKKDIPPKKVLANQVVSVTKPTENFNYRLVAEKTSSVIKRVNGLFNNESDTLEDSGKIVMENPDLTIEQSGSLEETAINEEKENHSEINVETNDTEMDEDLDAVTTNENIVEENNEEKVNDGTEDMVPQLKPSEDLFEEVEPFNGVQLFSDKYESENTPQNNVITDVSSSVVQPPLPISNSYEMGFDGDINKGTQVVPQEGTALNNGYDANKENVSANNNVADIALSTPMVPLSNTSEPQIINNNVPAMTMPTLNVQPPVKVEMPAVNNSNLEAQMPDVFWPSQEDNQNKTVNDKPTFDEQINMLMDNKDGRSK